MDRDAFTAQLRAASAPFDVVVIGGGATGAGIALDAASRGLSVVLAERGDFGCGTSSRSSKLIHGGVRYLALGQLALVREALAERALLLANANAVVRPLPFLLPATGRFDLLKFTAGLKLYDWLARGQGSERSARIDAAEARRLAPALRNTGLVGAVKYRDAQFDDARLLVALLKTANAYGALAVNYLEVDDLLKDGRGRVHGVAATDHGDGSRLEIRARCVINATGPFGDALRRIDRESSPGTLVPSQGAHIVVDAKFLGGDHAVVLPETPDGRIMFAIPWAGRLLLGTTDTAVPEATASPRPLDTEIDMILDVARRFLDPAPGAGDILSTFAGVRPLAATPSSTGTAKISREHIVTMSASGLISISGGKWTTYRRMAEDCVDLAVDQCRLDAGASITREIPIARGPDHGPLGLDSAEQDAFDGLLAERPALAAPVHAALPYCGAHFAWAARREMALNVADALRYRTRAAFIDVDAAADAVPRVAAIMAAELGRDAAWIDAECEAAGAALDAFRVTPTRARGTRG